MECFGDSSDDEGDEGHAPSSIQRDEACGVLSFHPNTEASLLAHVRNSTNAAASTASSDGLEAKLQRSADVLQAIDDFCMARHWMMHVGPEKGGILIDTLKAAMAEKMKRSSPGLDVPFVAVEIGTYCGYASVLMGRALCEADEAFLITTEINRQYAEIATEIIGLSGMQDVVSVAQISFDGHQTNVARVVGEALKDRQATTIDFLFIDHDKDSYKSDLCKLEASGMIRRGTKVVADNVLFAGIDDYLGYVQLRAKEGVVVTRTIPCHVEYSGSMQDGIEITDYLQDP